MKFTEQNPEELKDLVAKYNDLYKECAISHALLLEPWLLKIGDKVLGNVRYTHESISEWLSSNNKCPMGSTTVEITQENIFPDEQGAIIIKGILSNLENAIKENDVAEIKAWLQAGGDPDQLLSDGSSLIINAIYNNKIDIFNLLIQNNADVNQFVLTGDFCGTPPLSIAAIRGLTDIAEVLLAKGADLNQIIRHGGNTGYSALICAVLETKLPFVELLLDKGANVNQFVNGGDIDGGFPLYIAAARGHIETINLLIKYNALLNQIPNKGNDVGNSPLAVAIINMRNVNAIKLLLAHGADPNFIIKKGKNSELFPLYLAAAYGRAEAIEILINNGANPNQFVVDGDNKGAFSLYIAAKNGNIDAIKVLVAKGAKVNARVEDGDNKGFSSLYVAAYNNKHGEIVKLLIELGAYDIDNDFTKIEDINPELLEIINQANVLYKKIHNTAINAFELWHTNLSFMEQGDYSQHRIEKAAKKIADFLYANQTIVKEIIAAGKINILTDELAKSDLAKLKKEGVVQILNKIKPPSIEQVTEDFKSLVFSGAAAGLSNATHEVLETEVCEPNVNAEKMRLD